MATCVEHIHVVPRLCRNVGRMHQSVHRWRTAVLLRGQTCPKADLWGLPEAERDPADSEARGQKGQRDGDGDQDTAEEGERPGGGDTGRSCCVEADHDELDHVWLGGDVTVYHGPLNENFKD